MSRAIVSAACAAALALTPSGTVSARDSAPGALSEALRVTKPAGPSPGTTSYASGPLHGKVIVIDPGHQLGNSRHPRQINRQVNAGGFYKACNTTGTATNAGFPESTFAWRVSRALKRQLESRGASVYLTRARNSYADWGPCINVRGRKGNRVDADAVVSVHGDGASSAVRGFFVITPGMRKGWTDDIIRPSHRLGKRVKTGLLSAGAKVSNSYGNDGFDERTDLGTLNWSDKPIVMVELGNMRNARDARHMTSQRYRSHVFARGLRMGVANFVRHR